MGKRARMRPERLPMKLQQIREALGLSQSEMLRRLGFEADMVAARISEFELGKNEPPLPVLLEYARAANVSTDILIDDELDLPVKLPAKPRHK
ncbi:MAG: helix-turn-helix transcriptional regulator [Pyrinomonadaceae bacterium]